MRLTAHAGEWGGPASVRDAIHDLGVERIGHGVRAIEDLALVDELAEKGIVLEVCPGSNVTLGVYPSFRDHPIAELDRRGVKVTISTDDPPFFHTTMEREYQMLHEAFDWDDGVFAGIANPTSINRTRQFVVPSGSYRLTYRLPNSTPVGVYGQNVIIRPHHMVGGACVPTDFRNRGASPAAKGG